MPSERLSVRLFVIGIFAGGPMMFVGGAMTGCLRAIGVYPSNCNYTASPLGTALIVGGAVLFVVGTLAFHYQRPPKKEPESFVPDEDGLYPLKNA